VTSRPSCRSTERRRRRWQKHICTQPPTRGTNHETYSIDSSALNNTPRSRTRTERSAGRYRMTSCSATSLDSKLLTRTSCWFRFRSSHSADHRLRTAVSEPPAVSKAADRISAPTQNRSINPIKLLYMMTTAVPVQWYGRRPIDRAEEGTDH